MNQTPGPSETAEQQSTSTGPDAGPDAGTGQTAAAGVDRQHLRNYERLHRSTVDRKVAGVAGGLGRHLNIDPTILRVLFVVLCFFGGAGFVLYGVAWLIVPEDGQQAGKIATSPGTRNVLLIGAAVLATLLLLGDGAGGIGFPWPLFLAGIVVVVYLLLRGDRTVGASGAPATSYSPVDGQPPAPPAVASGYTVPAYQPPPRKRGPLLFGPTLALVAVALGVLGLYDAAGGGVADPAYPALALAVVGAMLLVGAFVGRAGGLVLLGLVATFALILTSIVGGFRGVDFRDGQRVSVAPATAAAVQSSYDLSSGRAVVDLSDVRNPRALDGRTIDVTGRAGELLVVLPQGVRSTVTADITGPGQIDLPDDSSGGFSTALSGQYGGGTTAVTIHTRLSAGHIDVRNPLMSLPEHTTDRASRPMNVSYLVMSLVFLGIAGTWALRAGDVVDTSQMQWLVPLVLVAAGVIGLVAFTAKGMVRGRRDRAHDEQPYDRDEDDYASFDPYAPYTDTDTDTDTEQTTRIEGDQR